MKITEDDLEFDFSDVLDVKKFDDKNHGLLAHGMSAVDFIVELKEAYLFIEVKDPSNPKSNGCNIEADKAKLTSNLPDYKENMKLCLAKKFRDTFLYRWAENKVDKPVHYLVLMTLDQPLLDNFTTSLKNVLPFKQAPCWEKQLVQTCVVLNIENWNRNYPKWKIQRISDKTK